MTLREEMEKASDQLQVDAEFGIKSIENFIDTETAIEIAERHLEAQTAKAVGHDLQVMPKIAEVIDSSISDYEEMITSYNVSSIFDADRKDCEQRVFALKELKDKLSNFSV